MLLVTGTREASLRRSFLLGRFREMPAGSLSNVFEARLNVDIAGTGMHRTEVNMIQDRHAAKIGKITVE